MIIFMFFFLFGALQIRIINIHRRYLGDAIWRRFYSDFWPRFNRPCFQYQKRISIVNHTYECLYQSNI